MYSHIIKGFSVGHLLTRRVLRRLTSLPGIVVDAIAAMFWAPNYRDYWVYYIPYADDTRVGVVEGIFGWIGEAAGFVLGGFLGAVIGLVVYGVDSVLSLVRYVQQNLYNALDALNQFIVELSPSISFHLIEDASSYLSKAINIGSFMLGGLIAVGPLLVTKTLEFCLPPLGDYLSKAVMYTSGWIGGTAMFLLALPMYPAVYLFKRGVELYSSLRETLRFSVAVVYGKTGTEPALDHGDDMGCGFPDHTLHSEEFRADVRYARESSWSVLIRNGFHRPAPAAALPPAPANVQPVILQQPSAPALPVDPPPYSAP